MELSSAIPGLMLFAHGSRDPEWAKPFNAVLEKAKSHYPGTPIALAYLEKMQPDFFKAAEDLIHAGCTQISIVPLFFARGGHLKSDLTKLLEEAAIRWPGIQWHTTLSMGESPFMQDALVEWIGSHCSYPTALQDTTCA